MTNTNKTTATGSCQICERTCKLPGGNVSLHGYKRPGFGWITGSCPGSHEPEYAVSCTKLVWYLNDVLLARKAHLDDVIAVNTDETINEIEVYDVKAKITVMHKRGEYVPVEWGNGLSGKVCWFNDIRAKRASEARNEMFRLGREIERCTKRIAAWQPTAK